MRTGKRKVFWMERVGGAMLDDACYQMESENLDQFKCNFNNNIYFILSTYFIVINFHISITYITRQQRLQLELEFKR